jgi:hypothetical protein
MTAATRASRSGSHRGGSLRPNSASASSAIVVKFSLGGRYLWHEFGDVHLLLP